MRHVGAAHVEALQGARVEWPHDAIIHVGAIANRKLSEGGSVVQGVNEPMHHYLFARCRQRKVEPAEFCWEETARGLRHANQHANGISDDAQDPIQTSQARSCAQDIQVIGDAAIV